MSQSPDKELHRLRRSFVIAVSFASILWVIALLDSIFSLGLVRHGVLPRSLDNLGGILWAPLIHGSLSHIFANTAPLIVLGTALLYGYPKSSKIAFPAIYIGTGVGVWLFARSAYHIGASGLNFGILAFVFTIGVLRWDKRAITLSLIVFFLYGGMIWGVLPSAPGVSFESHLFGAITGVLLAVLLRNHDPAPTRKRYSWEGEEEETGND
ncbi:MAG: rhomboid family intramembrane serine protease [Gammaproteobacteria bacterium]|nr:rhomboid family intramembrane serine protease [Gammaproteobacteria bacterium]